MRFWGVAASGAKRPFPSMPLSSMGQLGRTRSKSSMSFFTGYPSAGGHAEGHSVNSRPIPPPPAPPEVVGCDQPVQRLPSVAAQAEMAGPADAFRSTEDGVEAWEAAGARVGPMAGRQDRRFPRVGMKNRWYINEY